MQRYRYRLLNVFAPSTLAGNPLCVFEAATDMSTELMQALAIQFNLSETTFLLPSERATARVRIFSPGGEFPFAGHPVLGSAFVVRELFDAGDAFTLETHAGVIPLTCEGDVYRLRANPPNTRAPAQSMIELAAAVGLGADDLTAPPLWIDTGFEQLVVPARTLAALKNARVDVTRAQALLNSIGLTKIYLWVRESADVVQARFFFTRGPGQIGEDPGTGSACANLGGWLLHTGANLPVRLTVHQGDHLGRPCRLHLTVDSERNIFVGGRVVQLGTGEVCL